VTPLYKYALDSFLREKIRKIHTVSALWQIASGLNYLHQHHILHGKLKPSNILVDHDEDDDTFTLKLSDYGLLNEDIYDNVAQVKFDVIYIRACRFFS